MFGKRDGDLPCLTPVTPPDMPDSPYSHYKGTSGQAQFGNDWADTKGAIERILSYDKEQPLCLFVGWNNPHVPYTCMEPYYSSIDRGSLPRRISGDDMTGRSEIIRQLQQYVDMTGWTEEQWMELRATYLAEDDSPKGSGCPRKGHHDL